MPEERSLAVGKSWAGEKIVKAAMIAVTKAMREIDLKVMSPSSGISRESSRIRLESAQRLKYDFLVVKGRAVAFAA